jgi:leucine dehydrogenase
MNDNFNLLSEFDGHRLVSFIFDPKTGLEGFIALHRGSLENPAFGATRIVEYGSRLDALRDALRLSRLMSYKAAMAGLRYGGGKGVIILPSHLDPNNRREMLKAYALKVNYLGGHFVTGADVGITSDDLKLMRANSKYMVGTKSDPVYFTAQGLVNSIKVCLYEVYGSTGLGQRTFAIQGVGKVGCALLDLVYKEAKKVYIADIDTERLVEVKKKYPKVEVVSTTMIYRQKVDVFSPCALGKVLNPKTISKIKAPIIVGGANDQLSDPSVGELLCKLGILYAPDYVVNAGGLISVVDEYEHGRSNAKRTAKRLVNIQVILHSIIKQSVATGRATNIVADEMAEKIFNNH